MSGNQKGAKLLFKDKAGENGYSPASVPHRSSESSALKLQELCAPCNGPRDARVCRSGTVQQDAKGSDYVEPPVDKPKKWLEFAKASGSWASHFWPVLFICTFFGPKVTSFRGGTPLTSWPREANSTWISC